MSKKKRYAISFLSILAVIIILIGIFSARINIFLENYTRAKLISMLEKESDRLYDITYDSLLIDIYRGNVEVLNFSIAPRKVILDSLYKNNIPRKYVIDLRLGDFKLDNIELIEFLRTGEIELNGLLFKRIDGILYMNDTLKTRSTKSVGEDILSNQFVSALLHKIEISEGSLIWYETSGDTTNILSFDNFRLFIEELYSDSTLIKEERGASLTSLEVSLEHFRGTLVHNYDLKSDEISFNSLQNRLSVKNPSMTPSEEKVKSQNYFQLEVGQIDLFGLNYDSLIQEEMLLVEKVLVTEPVFTYIRPPQKLQEDTLRFLPAKTFKSIPIPLHIDTLQVRNGDFHYLKHGYGEPLLYFDISDIRINGYNFASVPVLMKPTNTFSVGGSLLFFKDTPVHMNFTFPMRDSYNSYTIHGVIDTLPAQHLNQIIKNPFRIRALSGTFNKMTFHINGNDTIALGDFEVDYSDLKLEALTIDSQDFTNTKRKGFNTFLVNTLARKKNDPSKSSFTKGVIYLERDDHQTFLDFNLSALMNGLVTSIIPESKGFIVPKEERKALREEKKEDKKIQSIENK